MANPAGDQVPQGRMQTWGDSTLKDPPLYPGKGRGERMGIVGIASPTGNHGPLRRRLSARGTSPWREHPRPAACPLLGKGRPARAGREYRPGFQEGSPGSPTSHQAELGSWHPGARLRFLLKLAPLGLTVSSSLGQASPPSSSPPLLRAL